MKDSKYSRLYAQSPRKRRVGSRNSKVRHRNTFDNIDSAVLDEALKIADGDLRRVKVSRDGKSLVIDRS